MFKINVWVRNIRQDMIFMQLGTSAHLFRPVRNYKKVYISLVARWWCGSKTAHLAKPWLSHDFFHMVIVIHEITCLWCAIYSREISWQRINNSVKRRFIIIFKIRGSFNKQIQKYYVELLLQKVYIFFINYCCKIFICEIKLCALVACIRYFESRTT